jgi:hypothetical protein
VSREGATLVAENEALIRSKGSAVRVLRSSAGLAESRVRSLQELIGDFEREMSRSNLTQVLDADTR